jgi:uncharacterized lipoprotein YmbA
MKKRIQIKRISWMDFYKNIKMYRGIEDGLLKYIGEYQLSNGELIRENFSFDIETYKENKDKMSYIDSFAKKQIAKQLAEKINKRNT